MSTNKIAFPSYGITQVAVPNRHAKHFLYIIALSVLSKTTSLIFNMQMTSKNISYQISPNFSKDIHKQPFGDFMALIG